MPSKIYRKGRRKEYKIVHELRKEGFHIVQRTAQSRSPIDIIAIDKDKKLIRLIQSKADSMSELKKNGELRLPLKRLLNSQWDLGGQYVVTFEVQ